MQNNVPSHNLFTQSNGFGYWTTSQFIDPMKHNSKLDGFVRSLRLNTVYLENIKMYILIEMERS